MNDVEALFRCYCRYCLPPQQHSTSFKQPTPVREPTKQPIIPRHVEGKLTPPLSDSHLESDSHLGVDTLDPAHVWILFSSLVCKQLCSLDYNILSYIYSDLLSTLLLTGRTGSHLSPVCNPPLYTSLSSYQHLNIHIFN